MTARKDELLAYVRRARDLGYDYAILGEHYMTEPYQQLHPWPLLARLIPESGTMRLLCTMIAPIHNPVMLVEVFSSLDVLSEGRIGLTFGLGYRDEEYAAFGVDRSTRVARQREVVETLLALWRNDAVTARGHAFTLEDATAVLRTVQQPHPPVWIAASADPAIERAAAWDLPWYTDAFSDAAELERRIALYAARRGEAGTEHDVHVMRELYCAPTRAEAFAGAAPYLHAMWRTYASWDLARALGRDATFADDFEDLARDRFVVGDPQACIAELKRYEQLGVQSVNLRMYWPGMPVEQTMRSLALFAEEVMPCFR